METEIKINHEKNITNIEDTQKLTRKWDVNKDELKAKINKFFGNKLENQEKKFKEDIKIVKPIKINFVELYHTLENMKVEVSNIVQSEKNYSKRTTTFSNRRKESRSFSRNSLLKRGQSPLVNESFNSKSRLNTSILSNKSNSKTPTKQRNFSFRDGKLSNSSSTSKRKSSSLLKTNPNNFNKNTHESLTKNSQKEFSTNTEKIFDSINNKNSSNLRKKNMSMYISSNKTNTTPNNLNDNSNYVSNFNSSGDKKFVKRSSVDIKPFSNENKKEENIIKTEKRSSVIKSQLGINRKSSLPKKTIMLDINKNEEKIKMSATTPVKKQENKKPFVKNINEIKVDKRSSVPKNMKNMEIKIDKVKEKEKENRVSSSKKEYEKKSLVLNREPIKIKPGNGSISVIPLDSNEQEINEDNIKQIELDNKIDINKEKENDKEIVKIENNNNILNEKEIENKVLNDKLLDNLNNLIENEKDFEEKNKVIDLEENKEIINHNQEIKENKIEEQNIRISQLEDDNFNDITYNNKIKRKKSIKELMNSDPLLLNYTNKKLCAFSILMKSKLVDMKTQLNILFLSKEIYQKEKYYQLDEFREFIHSKIYESSRLIERFYQNVNAQEILNKKLVISRSAITALNLIKSDEEKEYIKKATNDKQSDILRLILLFLNEDFSLISQAQLPEYIFDKIIKKYKVESFKKLVMEYIPSNILNTDFDLYKIIEFVSTRPYVFNSSEFISNNRLLSYCTFLIKDIFDFLNVKLSDGTHAYFVRRAPLLIKRYESKLEKLI